MQLSKLKFTYVLLSSVLYISLLAIVFQSSLKIVVLRTINELDQVRRVILKEITLKDEMQRANSE
jgi:hypothetical protein